jgi:hypothetical protein
VDESAEHVDPFDAPDVFDNGGCRFRWRNGHVEVDAAVRSGGVVVRDVIGQDTFKVAAIAHQHPVEAFGADGAPQRSAYAFAFGARGGVLSIWMPAAANTASKATVNFESPVADEKSESVGMLVEVHQQVAGGLGDPRAGGVGGDPGQVHPAVLQFDDEEHVQPGQTAFRQLWNRMVNRFFEGPAGAGWPQSWTPLVDVEETDDAWVFELDLLGCAARTYRSRSVTRS